MVYEQLEKYTELDEFVKAKHNNKLEVICRGRVLRDRIHDGGGIKTVKWEV